VVIGRKEAEQLMRQLENLRAELNLVSK